MQVWRRELRNVDHRNFINLTLLLFYFSSIYSCLFLYNNVSKGKIALNLIRDSVYNL